MIAARALLSTRGRGCATRTAAGTVALLCGVTLGGAGLATLGACGRGPSVTTLRFWAMGREGEVVAQLAGEFERAHPGLRVEVQQIPWTAAHEKLVTAFVGRSTPDLAQLGNTWVSEFAAMKALEPLQPRVDASRVVDRAHYFPGIWDTNLIDGELYGIPWYVDTRLLFYRTDMLARAGFDSIPGSWEGWRAAMAAVKRSVGPQHFAIFLPLNEWQPQVTLGLQAGSPLLADHDTRGAFSGPQFQRAFAFYRGLFQDGLAPSVGNNEIANIYQEMARGHFAMYITGPWNLGEFAHRLPPELQNAWATSPLPGPDGPASGVSLAGGSSLVLFRGARHKDEAWQLLEFLSQPQQQLRFYQISGDLPARMDAWQDSSLTGDRRTRAFYQQLQRVVPTPKIPEWEQIAMRVQDYSELAVRGGAPADSGLAMLDRHVGRILEKRRWLVQRAAGQQLARRGDGKTARAEGNAP